MADILIKNMRLPRNIDFKIRLEPNGDCTIEHGGLLPYITSAIELPPHGRLISDTALLHTLTHLKGATEHDTELLKEFEKMVRECPTIVEASNDKG